MSIRQQIYTENSTDSRSFEGSVDGKAGLLTHSATTLLYQFDAVGSMTGAVILDQSENYRFLYKEDGQVRNLLLNPASAEVNPLASYETSVVVDRDEAFKSPERVSFDWSPSAGAELSIDVTDTDGNYIAQVSGEGEAAAGTSTTFTADEAGTYTAEMVADKFEEMTEVALFGSVDVSTLTVTDQSENGNTGAIIGSTTTGNNGQVAEAFDFDGTDSGVDTSIQSLTPPLTISLWANPDQQTVGDSGMVFSNFVSGSDDLYIQQNGSSWQWTHDAGGVANGFGSAVDANSWQHVVMTIDGSNLIGYVNAVEQGRVADTTTTTIDNGNNFHIGIAAQITNAFDGQIDDVKVYDRVLTGPEVRRLYRSTAPYYKSEVDGVSSRNVNVKGASNPFVLLRNLKFFADYENWNAGDPLPNRWTKNSGIQKLTDNNTVAEETDSQLLGTRSGLYNSDGDGNLDLSDEYHSSGASPFDETGKDFYVSFFATLIDQSNFWGPINRQGKVNSTLEGWRVVTTQNDDLQLAVYDAGSKTVVNQAVADISQPHFWEFWRTGSNSEIHARVDNGPVATTSPAPFSPAGDTPMGVGLRQFDKIRAFWPGQIDNIAFELAPQGGLGRPFESAWLYDNGAGRTFGEIKRYTG